MSEGVYVVKGVEFRVEYDATAGTPAQLYGLPEDCDPGEAAEISINEIYIGEVEVSDVVSQEVKTLIEEQIAEEMSEMEPQFDEPDWMHDNE